MWRLKKQKQERGITFVVMYRQFHDTNSNYLIPYTFQSTLILPSLWYFHSMLLLWTLIPQNANEILRTIIERHVMWISLLEMFCGPVKLILYFVVTLFIAACDLGLFMNGIACVLEIFLCTFDLLVIKRHFLCSSLFYLDYQIRHDWQWLACIMWYIAVKLFYIRPDMVLGECDVLKYEIWDFWLHTLLSHIWSQCWSPFSNLEETHCYLWETIELLSWSHLCISFPRVHTSSTTRGRRCDGNGPCFQPIRCSPAPRPRLHPLLSITSVLGLLMSRVRSRGGRWRQAELFSLWEMKWLA